MSTKVPQLKSLLWPHYWPMWLGLGLLRLAIYLPFSLQQTLGRGLGRLLVYLVPQRSAVARQNIRLCFPDLPEAEKDALLKAHFESLGIAIFETGLSWWGSDAKLRPLLKRIKGLEHLENAQRDEHGVILLCSHVTPLEIGARLLLLYARFAGVYRPMNHPLLEYVTAHGRQTQSDEAIPKDNIKRMIRLLRQGKSIWFAADQNYRRKHSALVDFMGQPAPTAKVVPTLARAGKALVMPLRVARVPGGYEVEILPALENFPSGDEIADTRRYMTLIEEQIERAPEQYLWVHKRFKGAPDFDGY